MSKIYFGGSNVNALVKVECELWHVLQVQVHCEVQDRVLLVLPSSRNGYVAGFSKSLFHTALT